jgi:alpha-mannosidase
LTTVAVGHAHIDAAWLWPMRESIRKCGRTFASQLYYLKEYKDYVFGASQAQLYAFTREHYPELYQEIKDYVAEGRWEIQGGMWVEADCNIISGESMVRQFVHGKNFFRDEFGVDVKNLWLPDVFGYSAAMPQILKKSGCDYFLTQKISWNQFNQFPYHSFFWQGIDGNKVLTHFPPESNYNSPLEPEHLVKARNQYKENYLAPLFLTLFGMGNGGGGPKSETIENGLRAADVEGCPKVKFGRADDFFTQLEKYSELLPSWVGELYLEFHRGTLTSQGKSKLLNRRCEQILALTEFVCSCLPLDEYPDSELDKAWKTVLTNQFHDIIPGSSIREVYAVSEEELAGVLKLCEKLQTEAARKLLQADSQAITVVNTLSYPYTHAVRLPASWSNCEVFDENMSLIPTQSEDNGEVWGIGNFMPQSFTTLRRGKAVETQAKLVDTLVLENDLIRYEFNRNAHLISAFDKEAQRELIGKAGGNHLKLYVDRPHEWDAWDIDFDYEEHFLEEAIVTGISKAGIGKVRQTLRFELKVGASVLSQQMILSANSKRLDFVTVVQWREQHHMLRVNFDTTIDAPEAICDIQYGYVKRPTHTNTSWDFARFEVAAQRYVDISGPDGGVAMLNDCKYGHHLSSGALNLNLLRSPTSPDEIADQGEHTFTYSLLPHNGNFINSNVMPEAACLNRPPAVWEGALSAAMPCQVVKRSGVTLEVLKKAEKSNHRMIRCVENNGSNSSITLRFSDAKTLLETNLIEWEQLGEIYVENHLVTLNFKPFEIRTFIIK